MSLVVVADPRITRPGEPDTVLTCSEPIGALVPMPTVPVDPTNTRPTPLLLSANEDALGAYRPFVGTVVDVAANAAAVAVPAATMLLPR